MNNSMIGKILASLLLVVLCFLLGAMGADSAKSAGAVLMACLAVVTMLLIGRHAWILLFLLAPLRGVITPQVFSGLSVAMLVGNGILLYWIVLWMMGYVKLRWRSMIVLDLLIVCLFIYVVFLYMRHPVSILALGLDFDRIGGAAYLLFLSGIVYYLTLSVIPMNAQSMRKVLMWGAGLTVVAYVTGGILHVFGFQTVEATQPYQVELKDIAQRRFVSFVFAGMYAIQYTYARFPLRNILTSPLLIAANLAALAGVLMSALRGRFLCLVVVVSVMSVIKREFMWLVCLAFTALCGIYVMSAVNLTEKMPLGAQRLCAHLPGVTISKAAADSAAATMDWRYQLWSMALNPKTGYIKDYIWGDGIGVSRSENRRFEIAKGYNANLWYDNHLDNTARAGMWHNGLISAIHTAGYAGLFLMCLIYLCAIIAMFRTARNAPDNQMKFIVMFHSFPLLYLMEDFSTNGSAGITQIFHHMYYISLIKLLYCTAREEGWLQSIFYKRTYMPKMIHEYGDVIRGEQMASR